MVNAQHIKAVPGRKTDVKDAEWIADLAYQCESDEKSRVRGRVLIAQEHQPLPAEPRLARFRASGSPRATILQV